MRVATSVADLIANGVFRPGDRIPSVRRASRQHKVSVATAVQAYITLENRGLIEGRPKSGFFVRLRPYRLLPEPDTSRPVSRVARIASRTLLSCVRDAVNRPDMIQLGAGRPAPELLPVQKLNRMMASAARRAGVAALQYEMPRGCDPLRRALAR